MYSSLNLLLLEIYHPQIFIEILYVCSMNLDANQIETIKNYLKTCPVLNAYLFGS